MPVLNRIADYADEMAGWRRHLHENPELSFDCFETAAFVAAKLREFGVDEIHEGIGKTGIVAIINGEKPGDTIGLRADMDALPIEELTGKEYASKVPGKMHACGHDGHTTMLLGAAKYLCETRRFSGRVALLFQPAEEAGGGAEAMCKEGIMDRFAIREVYGIHNSPNQPFGTFRTTTGPAMASVDTAWVTFTGKGGHGSRPEACIDPIPAACATVGALQTIVARNLDPQERLVVSVTQIHSGTATNIIPDEAKFCATIRCYSPEVRDLVETRFRAIVEGQAAAFGVKAVIDYHRGYPATVNEPAKTAFAVSVAADVVGDAQVDSDAKPVMGSEDFSYMLEERPGAYLWLGIGPGPGVHEATYDFNDDVSPTGASFFVRLAERALPL